MLDGSVKIGLSDLGHVAGNRSPHRFRIQDGSGADARGQLHRDRHRLQFPDALHPRVRPDYSVDQGRSGAGHADDEYGRLGRSVIRRIAESAPVGLDGVEYRRVRVRGVGQRGAMFGVRTAEPLEGRVRVADIFQLLGQRVAEQQAILRIAGGPVRGLEPRQVVSGRRLLAQTGQGVMRATGLRIEGDQRLQRRLRIVRASNEAERDREVVTEGSVAGRLPDGGFETPHRCGMVTESGVDAAHGVEAEGVARRRALRFVQGLGGLPVTMNQ